MLLTALLDLSIKTEEQEIRLSESSNPSIIICNMIELVQDHGLNYTNESLRYNNNTESKHCKIDVCFKLCDDVSICCLIYTMMLIPPAFTDANNVLLSFHGLCSERLVSSCIDIVLISWLFTHLGGVRGGGLKGKAYTVDNIVFMACVERN